MMTCLSRGSKKRGERKQWCREQNQKSVSSSYDTEHQGAFHDAFLDRVLFLVGGVVDESRQLDLKLRFREGDF
jgi:hypothetical protein